MPNPNKNILDKTFKFLGDNANAAIIVTCVVAGFKGIFRPLFTMMDKKSDPETKKYAAIREGLTEVVAIPVYIAIPTILGKMIEKAKAFKTPHDKKIAQGNAKFFGVCASTLLIPAVCNVIQPPIMKAYKAKQEAKKAQMNKAQLAEVNKPTFKGQLFKGQNVIPVKSQRVSNYGMKVGG